MRSTLLFLTLLATTGCGGSAQPAHETKVAKHEAEAARVAVRAVRHDLMNELKEMLKERLISEDDHRRGQEEIQKLTDRHVHDIDAVLGEKEKELLQV